MINRFNDGITLAMARAVLEERESEDSRGRHVHTWERLPYCVSIVTPARGRERFDRVKPLLERLRELRQGGVEISQIRSDGRAWTPESIAALTWYIDHVTLAGVSRLVKMRAPIITREWWEILVAIVGPCLK